MVVNLHNWRYRHGVRGQGIGTQKKRVAKTSRQDYNETSDLIAEEDEH
jgi:hypothetical protein